MKTPTDPQMESLRINARTATSSVNNIHELLNRDPVDWRLVAAKIRESQDELATLSQRLIATLLEQDR
jgi:hypothetical protein